MLDSMSEIIRKAEEENKKFWEVVLEDDMATNEYSKEDSFIRMMTVWQAMEEASDSYTGERRSVSGLVGGDGLKMRQYTHRDEAMSGDYVSRVITEALSMAESSFCRVRMTSFR